MTFADVGGGALRAALALALWGLVASAYAARGRDGRALGSARWSALAAFGLILVASLAMAAALLTHDFSIRYVAFNNALETPAYFSAISLWAALEGSILLWTTVLAGAVTFVAWRGTRELPRLATTALAVMFAMLAFFLFLVVTPAADPFVRIRHGAPRSSRGRSSASASSRARGGRTPSSAGAGTGPGIPWRTPRSCRGSSRRPTSIR